jgi:hypothetical protein
MGGDTPNFLARISELLNPTLAVTPYINLPLGHRTLHDVRANAPPDETARRACRQDEMLRLEQERVWVEGYTKRRLGVFEAFLNTNMGKRDTRAIAGELARLQRDAAIKARKAERDAARALKRASRKVRTPQDA